MINVIADQNDLGAALSSHADVAKVAFTGSTATGKKVMSGAVNTLKRLTLELGGNDAAIVLDDVDPIEVAPKLFAAAMMNSGQVCLGAKRIYVHESQYDQICNELGRLAREAVVDDGLKQGTQMGPLQNKDQFEKVRGFLDDAKRDGKIVAGGEALSRSGYFIQPTIVRDIADDARLVTEEQFGPVVPVLSYSDLDDAIARANNSVLWTRWNGMGKGSRSSVPGGRQDRNRYLSGSISFSRYHPMWGLVVPSNQGSVGNWVRKGLRHSPRPRSSTSRSSAGAHHGSGRVRLHCRWRRFRRVRIGISPDGESDRHSLSARRRGLGY